MAFISTILENQAAVDVKQMYDKNLETLGYIPNYSKVFSHRPKVMEIILLYQIKLILF